MKNGARKPQPKPSVRGAAIARAKAAGTTDFKSFFRKLDASPKTKKK